MLVVAVDEVAVACRRKMDGRVVAGRTGDDVPGRPITTVDNWSHIPKKAITNHVSDYSQLG